MALFFGIMKLHEELIQSKINYLSSLRFKRAVVPTRGNILFSFQGILTPDDQSVTSIQDYLGECYDNNIIPFSSALLNYAESRPRIHVDLTNQQMGGWDAKKLISSAIVKGSRVGLYQFVFGDEKLEGEEYKWFTVRDNLFTRLVNNRYYPVAGHLEVRVGENKKRIELG